MAKRYPPKLKFQVVLELLTGEKSMAQLAKTYGVHPQMDTHEQGEENVQVSVAGRMPIVNTPQRLYC